MGVGNGPSKLEVASHPPPRVSFFRRGGVCTCWRLRRTIQVWTAFQAGEEHRHWLDPYLFYGKRMGRSSATGWPPQTAFGKWKASLCSAVSNNGFPAAFSSIFFCFKFFCPPHNAVISLVTNYQSPAAELLRSTAAVKPWSTDWAGEAFLRYRPGSQLQLHGRLNSQVKKLLQRGEYYLLHKTTVSNKKGEHMKNSPAKHQLLDVW